ncbi:DUF4181 domain-containing protein [Cytobacillus dafuensis]|uniref:DUF4181 domain-containing protein n=1 Tax=Cytobacillus dafuensis TaxID=1742359 RepID=UPI00070B49F8|nr:DUF4181 domain-containing protein [Cytobacillus dafuensis]
MNTFSVVGIVIVFTIYILVDQVYLKRHLGIKSKYEWLFSVNRKTYAKIIDFLILILFIIIFLNLNSGSTFHTYSPVIRTSPMFGMFFLQNVNQGIEELLINRTEKSYYHKFLGSFMILVTFLILFVGERV